ncbi:MAG: hypothetical protein CMJ90_08455 [Planctomycetes bacterium]|nr:hypothetical protein [Planctomycetota bacterium]
MFDFFVLTKKMGKSKVAKIFKVVKKTVDDKDQLVIRYKNLTKKDAKELKNDLNEFCQAYQQKIVTQE